jgi:succinoglycan biosynthesis protein ExoA
MSVTHEATTSEISAGPPATSAIAAVQQSDSFSSYISPEICIIIPALNEEAYIEACLESLLRQSDCRVVEIIVSDGGSTDKTIARVTRLMQIHPVIKLMHNPMRIQSAGINLAAALADPRAEVFVRADAHVAYGADFVVKCVTALRHQAATSVVVPMRTVGRTGFQRAVAAVQNSKLGNGGAAHRSGGQVSGFVDHGHHAAFDRAFFRRCGGYDESFTHNEDAELDHRAHLAGGRVWMCTEACVDYFPRTRPAALARQYWSNGKGRAKTLVKHGMRPRMRQLAPVFLLLMVAGGLALSPLWWGFALPPLAYVAACSLVGVAAAVRQKDPWMLAVGPAAITMHLSYGVGFIQTLLRHLRLKYSGTGQPSQHIPHGSTSDL